ncbi:MAG TPA: hypothetical protein VF176_00290 [Solirubrobacterales bacterium]
MRRLWWIAAVGLLLPALGTADEGALGAPDPSGQGGVVYAPVQYEPAPPAPLIGIKAERRRVRRHKPAYIVVWISPCRQDRTLAVRLLRDGRLNGSKFLSRACTAHFHPRIRRRTTFTATLVPEDADQLPPTSRQLTIKIDHRRG